ncbi:SMI1/KNR4 family protein [bacterium]|nr:MAG: SMI1/KNR4 family protein [bacterium]
MNFLESFSSYLAAVDVEDDMNAPASSETIQQVEAALSEQDRIRGFKMPPSYRSFLLKWDGGSANWDGGETEEDDSNAAYVQFFSVAPDEAHGCDVMRINKADSVLMNHEIETYFPFEPLVLFASDEGSNFWAFDPRETRKDGEMPVRFCDHETGDIYAQAEDFPSFILALSNRELKYRSLDEPLNE